MKLEVGKRYVMRNGYITNVMQEASDKAYPFKDGTLSWKASGGYAMSGAVSQLDIVSEYIEPAPEPLRWVENCKPDKPGIWAWRYDTSRSTRPTRVVDLSDNDCRNCSVNGIEWCYLGPIPEILPPKKRVVYRLWVIHAGSGYAGQMMPEGECPGERWIRTDETREVEQ